jgi:hypothetical protein
MNKNKSAEDHKSNTDKYLRDTQAGYSINLQSGLYEPCSFGTQENQNKEILQELSCDPRPKGSWADWGNVGVGVVGNVISVLTLIGLMLTALFSIKQWHEAHITANASVVSANAAQDATDSAKRGLAQSRDQFIQDQRPYVWVARDLGTPKFFLASGHTQGQVFWEWHFTNYGKSPAYHVILHNFIKIGDAEFVPSYDGLGKETTSIKKYLKGSGAPLPPTDDQRTAVISPPTVTQEDFDRLSQTDQGITAKGVIDYTDAGGIPHQTGVCISKLKTGAILYCKDGNYTH